MALAFLGDLHGDVDRLLAADAYIAKEPGTIGIQVGDFWLHAAFYGIKLRCPWYFIDGNHEDFGFLSQFDAPTVVMPDLTYCPRGTILRLDGRTIGFCGGAASVDKALRLKCGFPWDDRENITDGDLAKFRDVPALDVLVTHAPPMSVREAHFDNSHWTQFDLPIGWTDPSMEKVDALWKRYGCPPLVCGHMHRAVLDGNVRILDIGELVISRRGSPTLELVAA